MQVLKERILKKIVAELGPDHNTLSIVLIGSGVRGELDDFSDLDIHVVVRDKRPPDRLFYQENRLVNINFLDGANREAMLTDPWQALWNLAAVREARILYDPEGWYTHLQQRAKAFAWQSVAKDADSAVSWVLAEHAEIVHKILSGLGSNNHEKTLHATNNLLQGLNNVSALANGVLCNSENRFWSMVRDAEHDQAWKRLYWTALGFEGERVVARAKAALALYQRSSLLYKARLLPQHVSIIEHVCGLIEAREE